MFAIPIFKNFKENSILNVFLLGSILQTVILTLTLISHESLKNNKLEKKMHFIVSTILIFLINFISFVIMYLMFGYGYGMLA